MSSSVLNVTSVTSSSVTLDGLVQLSDHRWLFFSVFSAVYLFVLCSDGLVVYVICSQRNLHRPMFVFVAALLLNSLSVSVTIYPKLLTDLTSGCRFVEVSRAACLCQALVVGSLGSSSFMLLATMALDRYLSICRPLRYAALLTPAAVAALLLFCWRGAAGRPPAALPLCRLPLCRSELSRVYCNIYSFVSLSCGGGAALLLNVYGMVSAAAVVFLPAAFVLFSYGRILSICLRRSQAFSSKALHTCLPHLLVFINYSLSLAVEMLLQRLEAGGGPATSVLVSILLVVIPTLFNPVVYGLKMKEIFTHVKRLLSCSRAD